MNSQFTKTFTKTVDQRNQMIPVALLPKMPSGQSGSHYTSGRFITSGGKYLTDQLVRMIDEAQETIVFCSFLLADKAVEDALFHAAERNVRIYALMASETRLDSTSDDDFAKKCLSEHKAMLKRLAGKMFVRSAPHFHAKFVLVDALSQATQAKGMLLTANLTSEALERNEELSVILEPSEISGLTALAKWVFFEDAEHQMLDNVNFETIKPAGKVAYPTEFQSVCHTSKHSKSILKNVLDMIRNTKQELIISSFGWEENHLVIQEIIKQAQAGIRITALARARVGVIPTLVKLAQAGVDVHLFKYLHAKAIVSDNKNAMVMTANLAEHGLDSGFEVGIRMAGAETTALKQCLNYFLSRPHETLHVNAPLGGLSGSIRYFDKEFKVLEITSEKNITLNDIQASSLTDLDLQANIPQSHWQKEPAHALTYHWKVLPPLLPKNSQEQFWEEKQTKLVTKTDKKGETTEVEEVVKIKHSYRPKVFKHDSRICIAIESDKDFQTALTLKGEKFKQADIVLSNR